MTVATAVARVAPLAAAAASRALSLASSSSSSSRRVAAATARLRSSPSSLPRLFSSSSRRRATPPPLASRRVASTTAAAAIDAEEAARRDDLVAGCVECTLPLEIDRAAFVAREALKDRGDSDASDAASDAPLHTRCLVVGAETGKLASALLENGATHVLVIDVSRAMLDRAAEAFDELGASGNAPGVRFLLAEVAGVPPYQGPFDVIVFNDTLTRSRDPADAIRRATLLGRPGTRVVVSSRTRPEYDEDGDEIVNDAADADPRVNLSSLVGDLPLTSAISAAYGKQMRGLDFFGVASERGATAAASVEDPTGGTLHVFEIPPAFALRRAIELRAPVVYGFGRGSKKMGVPTANLDPDILEEELGSMRKGVYFGYARLPADEKHAAWTKCVVNVGSRWVPHWFPYDRVRVVNAVP